MNISIIGGGSWGTALAVHLARMQHSVQLLLRSEEQVQHINTMHTNPKYLQDIQLPLNITASTDAKATLGSTDICILCIPCQYMRATLVQYKEFFHKKSILLCASKGIEVERLACMHEVVAECLPQHSTSFAMLSGPSFALELAQGKPTSIVLGCRNKRVGTIIQHALSNEHFRIYLNQDLLGVELGGAFKNTIAIATGICDGLQLGSNARAALITRGLAEMSRLGSALGAKKSTFMGLSGMGDLLLTCTGDLSRNRQLGLRLGKGESLQAILASMHNVAEGVPTTKAACLLARKHNIELPLAESLLLVLEEQISPRELSKKLMTRDLREE